jgi:hypothetical protein
MEYESSYIKPTRPYSCIEMMMDGSVNIESIVVNAAGTGATVTFIEPMTGDGQIFIRTNNGSYTSMSPVSGDGTNIWEYTIDATFVWQGDGVKFMYNGFNNDLHNIASVANATRIRNFSEYVGTNNSTQTRPVIESATVDSAGTTLTIVFDRSVSGSVSFTLGAQNLSLVSGENTATYVYSIPVAIRAGETPTLGYTEQGNAFSIRDGDGHELKNFSNLAVTNGSTISQVTIQSSQVTSDGQHFEVTFTEAIGNNGLNSGNCGFTLNVNATPGTLGYQSGDATSTLTFAATASGGFTILGGDTLSASFSGGLLDSAGNTIQAVSNFTPTNNSTQ